MKISNRRYPTVSRGKLDFVDFLKSVRNFVDFMVEQSFFEDIQPFHGVSLISWIF
jgi:hypothetical protein